MAKTYSKAMTKGSAKIKAPKLGVSASSKPPSPLMPKKDYRKTSAKKTAGLDFGTTSFGLTGLTGES